MQNVVCPCPSQKFIIFFSRIYSHRERERERERVSKWVRVREKHNTMQTTKTNREHTPKHIYMNTCSNIHKPKCAERILNNVLVTAEHNVPKDSVELSYSSRKGDIKLPVEWCMDQNIYIFTLGVRVDDETQQKILLWYACIFWLVDGIVIWLSYISDSAWTCENNGKCFSMAIIGVVVSLTSDVQDWQVSSRSHRSVISQGLLLGSVKVWCIPSYYYLALQLLLLIYYL